MRKSSCVPCRTPHIWLSEQGAVFFEHGHEARAKIWRRPHEAEGLLDAYVNHGREQLTRKSPQISLAVYGLSRSLTVVVTASSIGAAKGGGYARYLKGKTVQPERGDYYLTPGEYSAGSPSASSGGVSVGLRDLDAKGLRGVREASVVAVETLEVLTQAYDGCQVQGVE